MQIEIDELSGFCFGVTTAIGKAEEELRKNGSLYCLGDIVHNSMECQRLHDMGLKTIGHGDLESLQGKKVLLRAHGEPPETYATAKRNRITVIDATCPVVLQLQRRIKRQYDQQSDAQIVIFGKHGHAEVLGLVGQTEGKAIVIASKEDLRALDMSKDIFLYSQTTKSLDEFRSIIHYIEEHISKSATFRSFDTICRQVANRMPNICAFAKRHDVVLFVSGRKSSNGKVLFQACKAENERSYLVEGPKEIDPQWFKNALSVGICGATSTPKWLMEQCKARIEALKGQNF